MGTKLELVGKRFGKLLVIREIGKNEFGTYNWFCKCDCGIEKIIRGSSLTAGNTTSCGCAISDSTKERFTKHGATNTAEYLAWENMKARCYQKSNVRYEEYGGRGIKVCDEWKFDFNKFFDDMGLKPSERHSLDRYPDIDGNYEPTNCRWATIEQQNRNKRDNVWVECGGLKMILMDWSNYLSVHYMLLKYHLKKKNMRDVIEFYYKKGKINKDKYDQIIGGHPSN